MKPSKLAKNSRTLTTVSVVVVFLCYYMEAFGGNVTCNLANLTPECKEAKEKIESHLKPDDVLSLLSIKKKKVNPQEEDSEEKNVPIAIIKRNGKRYQLQIEGTSTLTVELPSSSEKTPEATIPAYLLKSNNP